MATTGHPRDRNVEGFAKCLILTRTDRQVDSIIVQATRKLRRKPDPKLEMLRDALKEHRGAAPEALTASAYGWDMANHFRELNQLVTDL